MEAAKQGLHCICEIDRHLEPVILAVLWHRADVQCAMRAAHHGRQPAEAIKEHISPRATMMTDELSAYRAVSKGPGHDHHAVNHGVREYVRGDIHTNTVEGFFSLLKRGINGVYHHVSRGHLPRYCDEFAFRYEHRKVSDGARAKALVGMAEGKRLTYQQPAKAS